MLIHSHTVAKLCQQLLQFVSSKCIKKNIETLSFFTNFRTRYVRWILSIHLTPPYGLILPSCAWTAIQAWQIVVCQACRRGILWTPLNKLGNQEDSPSPTGSLIRGANLAFSPRYSPFHLCHRNFNLLIWQPLFPPRTKSNQGFFPAYARIFSFF